MTEPIIWTPERLPLSALLPKKWKRNPRQSSKRTAENLAATKERFAQPYPILIDLNGDMVDGHQRIDAWAHKWGKDLVVDVSRANREFSEEERQEFVLLFHQGAFGQWDYDALANFDPAQLATFGFDQDALDQTRREMAFLIEMLGEGFTEGEGENDPYEEWEGMPEFENEDNLGAVKTIKVHFATQEDVERFSSIIGQQVTEGTKYIWFPKQEKESLKAYQVINE